ncbi:uncharacterized protein PAC_03905 [Phialocephala subalpina]|uniref:Ras-associating domain-containing protein n=1 Tax=Phialocephala subalpina TaxID=576137 RepID=A0A1L7WMM2_9HELO|nr:uncharacterized protein PAC_03905 [Phialocephala subalpina]
MTFASEYEFLCSELSILWLRIKLWGQSIGLTIDADQLQSTLTTRPDVESTITQCVGSIAHLLTEIEVIRRNYEFRPPLIPDGTQNEKALPLGASYNALSKYRPAITVRQRIRDNQKQKSYLTIAKWTICDAKRFEEKVKQLRSLIDGLEDISTAAGITRLPLISHSASVVPSENPPPYSFRSSVSPQLVPSDPSPSPIPPHTPTEPSTSRPATTSILVRDPEVSAHHTAMMRHCGLSSSIESHPRWRAREKMTRLSNAQFKELRTDIYDEMFRRELSDLTPPSLPPNPEYHPKRNQARQKLSTLPSHRFKDLVIDVLFELEKRFPSLMESNSPGVVSRLQSTFSEPRPMTSRRYGTVPPRGGPPLPLSDRAAHPAALSPTSPSSATLPFSRFSQVLSPTVPGNVEIFKSFRVTMDDKTFKVLPAAMKKYNINAPFEDYSLYVVYGDQERRLDLDEQPLAIFKELDRKGLRPMFMLRKTVVEIGKVVAVEASTAAELVS